MDNKRASINKLQEDIKEILKQGAKTEIVPPLFLFCFFENMYYKTQDIIYIYAPEEIENFIGIKFFLEELQKATKPLEEEFEIYYSNFERILPMLDGWREIFEESDVIPISKELKFYDFAR